MKKKYKIGLALSGGVFRGVAHAGVIQALKEHDIFPDAVIGTSAGAIAGALYASGKTAEEMMEFVKKWAWIKAVRPGFALNGLSSLAFLKEHLLSHLGHDAFEQLEKPLYVSVTNMNEGTLEIMNTGSLTDVIMASCSIPMVFKPVEIDGTIYTDGGVMCNLAIEPLRSECEVLIGVNVMAAGTVESKSLTNVIGIAQRLFYLSVIGNSRTCLEQCDVLIEPEVGDYSIFKILTKDFTGIYEAGYESTMSQIPEILRQIDEKVNSDTPQTLFH